MDAETPETKTAAIREPVKLSPREGYRLWSRSWDADSNPIVGLESRHLGPMLPDLAGRRFLDVGCGTGRWLARARVDGATILGLDFCREMLLEAGNKPGIHGRLLLADACCLPVPDCWADVVLFALALGYVKSLEAVLLELARTAKIGGIMIVSDFHPGAASRGWKRTFRSGSQVYEIENHPYTVDRLTGAAESVGLELEELLEPCFDEPERAIFRRAGKEQLFEEARGAPAVIIGRWRRRR